MWVFIVILAIVFIVFVIIPILAYRASMHCSNCKKYGMEQIDKKEVDRYSTTKRVTEKVRNKKGEVIRTVEKEVPATKIIYSCTFKCKYCGFEEKRKKDEVK